MPWLVGIDEAGYGPNLGPLVMTAVAGWVPSPLFSADLWQALHGLVRRQADPEDGRLLVDDSKRVYTAGLARLETGVLALSAPALLPIQLANFLETICPEAAGCLRPEVWYCGKRTLPVMANLTECRNWGQRWREQDLVRWHRPRVVIVCPAEFNTLLDRAGSKSAVLGFCLGRLLRRILKDIQDGEPINIHIDKHGGRNFYGPQLQDMLEAGTVLANEEGRHRSVYRVLGLAAPLCVTFTPRADSTHFTVALASMVSKYVREVLMLEFNHFWQQHVPGLRPTAGYPQDARRFWQTIDPVVRRLGLPPAALWRYR